MNKITLVDVQFILGILAVFWPWIIGSIEFLSIFFVDHTVIGINWTDGKIFFAMMYPVIVSSLIGAMFLS